MDVYQVQAARDYVREASGRGVLAISPAGLAQRLGCDELTATGLLLRIQKYDGLVDVKGSIECPRCRERMPLREHSADALINEANSLAGTTCPYCDAELDSPRVRFAFFFVAAPGSIRGLS